MCKYLIGESSWDLECFNIIIGKCNTSYLHNDFFNSSNKDNTRKIRRLLAFLNSFVLSFKALINRDEVYYSSLNSEVLIVALIFSKYSKSRMFIPNVIGYPEEYSLLFNYVLRAYRGKIIVSDEITEASLSQFNPISNDLYTFNIPAKDKLKNISYVVALPGAYSHNAVKNEADKMYEYSFEIAELLEGTGVDVYLLPHPRDIDYIKTTRIPKGNVSLITSEEIRGIVGDTCILSAHSSLSLNRRFGGKFGCWIKIGNKSQLHPSLVRFKGKLVDINYFCS
jgi:hypothetical protein